MLRCPRAFPSAPNLEIRINDTFGTDAEWCANCRGPIGV